MTEKIFPPLRNPAHTCLNIDQINVFAVRAHITSICIYACAAFKIYGEKDGTQQPVIRACLKRPALASNTCN